MNSSSSFMIQPKKRGVKAGTIRGPYKTKSKLGVLGASTVSDVKQEEISEWLFDPTEFDIVSSINPAVLENEILEENLKWGDVDDDPYNQYRFVNTPTNSYYEDNLAVIRNRALQTYTKWIKDNLLKEQALKNKNNDYVNNILKKI